MCGIAGFFGTRTLAPAAIEQMIAALRQHGVQPVGHRLGLGLLAFQMPHFSQDLGNAGLLLQRQQ